VEPKNKVVYHADNCVEAQMIRVLLEVGGIESFLDEGTGDKTGLQGSITQTSVYVKDSDYSQANGIITSRKEGDTKPAKPAKKSPLKSLMAFAVGILLAVPATYMYVKSNFILISHEDDQYNFVMTGRKDIFGDDGVVKESHFDRNRDKKVDEIYFYDDNLFVTKIKSDHNFNGFFETVTYFDKEKQLAYLVESDIDEDHNVDRKVYFKNGVLQRQEYISPRDAIIYKVEIYSPFSKVEEKVDFNKDGEFDLLRRFDKDNEVISEENLSEFQKIKEKK
jgi:hypothetical protein